MANQIAVLQSTLEKGSGEFAKSLPGHITPEKFIRTAKTAIAMTRNIEKVKNPRSLLMAVSKAAADGLVLDGREAALVIDYNGEARYQPMVRGLLKLAENSGMLKSIIVQTVRENDVFDYEPTSFSKPISHRIDFRKPRGEIYAVYAMVELRDGGVRHEVMSLEQVNKIRDRSDGWKAFVAKKIKSTPWSTDWEEMARKTVLRRLTKYLPTSADKDAFRQAVERIDDEYDFAIDAEPGDAPVSEPAKTKKRGGAASALKRAAEPQQTPHDPETGEIIDVDPEDIDEAPAGFDDGDEADYQPEDDI